MEKLKDYYKELVRNMGLAAGDVDNIDNVRYNDILYKTEIGNYSIKYHEWSPYFPIKSHVVNREISLYPPRSCMPMFETKRIPEESPEELAKKLLDKIEKDVKKKLKDKQRREAKRPIDTISLLAAAFDEAEIDYYRHGNELRLKTPFMMNFISDGDNKIRINTDKKWGMVNGDIVNPQSEMIEKIVDLAKEAMNITKLLNKCLEVKV